MCRPRSHGNSPSRRRRSPSFSLPMTSVNYASCWAPTPTPIGLHRPRVVAVFLFSFSLLPLVRFLSFVMPLRLCRVSRPPAHVRASASPSDLLSFSTCLSPSTAPTCERIFSIFLVSFRPSPEPFSSEAHLSLVRVRRHPCAPPDPMVSLRPISIPLFLSPDSPLSALSPPCPPSGGRGSRAAPPPRSMRSDACCGKP